MFDFGSPRSDEVSVTDDDEDNDQARYMRAQAVEAEKSPSPLTDTETDGDGSTQSEPEPPEPRKKIKMQFEARIQRNQTQFHENMNLLSRVRNSLRTMLLEVNPDYGDWITPATFADFVIANSSSLQGVVAPLPAVRRM